MKNLIRGHIYQLRRDYFFYGCLAVSIVYLFMSIRLTLSLASALSPLMGVDGLLDTFLGGDTILYAFMLLTANMIAEAYRTGVMKNIIGRGIAKKQYYLSIVLMISTAYVLVMLIGGIIMAAWTIGFNGSTQPCFERSHSGAAANPAAIPSALFRCAAPLF